MNILSEFRAWLKRQNYASSTIETYYSGALDFFHGSKTDFDPGILENAVSGDVRAIQYIIGFLEDNRVNRYKINFSPELTKAK